MDICRSQKNRATHKPTLHMVTLSLAVLLSTADTAEGQFLPTTRNLDVSLGATTHYATTGPLPTSTMFETHPDTPALLIGLRYHPFTWVGVQIGYNSLLGAGTSEASSSGLPRAREGFAAFLVHSHFRSLQPFVSVGGAALASGPLAGTSTEFRPAVMIAAGVDVPSPNPHFGMSVEAHGLWCNPLKASSPTTSTSTWSMAFEPSASAYVRF